MGVIAYAGSLGNGFVWDDNFQIVRNPYLHADQPWSRLLFSDVWGYIRAGQASLSNYYRPLQMATYRLTYAAADLEPAAYHAVSLILNVLASLAAYLVARRLTRSFGVGLAAATLFAVHPIHSEAVLWIAALTELGCALFYFLAFWLFLLAEPAPVAAKPERRKAKSQPEPESPGRRRWLLAGSCACFLSAVLWKEMALTLPVVIGAYVLLFSPAETWTARLRRVVVRTLPFWAVLAAYIGLRVSVLGYFSRVQHSWPLSALQFVINQVVLVGEYCLRLVVPGPLNAFHVFHPVLGIGDWRLLAAVAFLAAAGVALIYAARRAPVPAFAGAWVFLTLVPVLNLQGVGENVFAERYLYIPSLGLVVLVAWAGAELLRRVAPNSTRTAAVVAVSVVSVAGLAQVRARIPEWKTDRALYESALRVDPDGAIMHNSLAQVLVDARELDGAEREYQEGLRIAEAQNNKSQAANAYLGLAGVAWRRGRAQQGLEFIDRGLAADPQLPALHSARGILLLQLGRVSEAEPVLLEAYQYFPTDEVILNALGVIALGKREYERAADYFQKAIAAVPSFADGYNNLGQTYAAAGRVAESLPYFQRAVELQPGNPLFHTNLGTALARQGKIAEARVELERALQIDPGNASARAGLETLSHAGPPTR